MRRALLCVIAIAVSLTPLACGGDDDGDDGLPTGDVSKREYIAKADAVCAEVNGRFEPRVEALYERAGTGIGEEQDLNRGELEELVNELIVPLFEDLVDGLRELEAPEADAEKLEQTYNDIEEYTDEIAEDPALYTDAEHPLRVSIQEDLEAYGFEECS